MEVSAGFKTMYEWVKGTVIEHCAAKCNNFRYAVNANKEECPDMPSFFRLMETNGIIHPSFISELEELLRALEFYDILKNVIEPYKMLLHRYHYKRRYLIRECKACVYEREIVYLLPCRHSGICWNCAWSKTRPVCPFCRSEVNSVRYIEEDDIPTDIFLNP